MIKGAPWGKWDIGRKESVLMHESEYLARIFEDSQSSMPGI